MEQPGRKISYQNREQTAPSVKLAGVVLRRKRSSQNLNQSYDPLDYEVLLRHWLAEPFQKHLAVFSGPILQDEDPAETLLNQCYNWTKKLATTAGHSELEGIKGIKAVFLTIAGETAPLVPMDSDVPNPPLQTMFSYIISVTEQRSQTVSCYPTNSVLFPHFYCLGSLLRAMYSGDSKLMIHSTTQEILSSLDRWLREHHLLNTISRLFSLPAQQRVKESVTNPIYQSNNKRDRKSNYKLTRQVFEQEPVDIFVKNPLFGCDMIFGEKVDKMVVNEFFGKGEPNYYAIGTRAPQWTALPEDGDVDWLESYPLHKCALEGDEAGLRRFLISGYLPNDLDNEGWAPLHYACWYNELRAVQVLVEEGGAYPGIRNENGSTPLHTAAGNGADDIVRYLLDLPAVNPGALDNKGMSPLAVCLEYKTNNWETTAALLRRAYEEQVDGVELLSVSAGGRRQQRRVMFAAEEEVVVDQEPLQAAGSQNNLIEADTTAVTVAKPTNIRKTRVNFMNGHHMLAAFPNGKNTKAVEALQGILHATGIHQEYQYLLALWVSSSSLSVQLGDTDKPIKLITKWNSMLKKFANTSPSTHSTELPALYLRRNVFYPINREATIFDPAVLGYLYEDAQNRVLTGDYPCTEEEAVLLAAITMQLSYGDYNKTLHQPGFLKDKLSSMLPPGIPKKIKRKLEFERRILAKHEDLTYHQYSITKLHHHYLELCRKWPYYGATFYEGTVRNKLQRSLSDVMPSQARRIVGKSVTRIGVNTRGIHVIQNDTNAPIHSYPLDKMEWDMSSERHEFTLRDKTNSTQEMILYTKQAALLHSLATRMKEEMQSLSSTLKKLD